MADTLREALEPTIAGRILATIAQFRRKGTLESSLCWPAGELERLAMFAIAAKNDLALARAACSPRGARAYASATTRHCESSRGASNACLGAL